MTTENNDRQQIDYLKRIAFTDVEKTLQETLGKRFGKRFLDYRKDYHRTLNADRTGFVPDKPVSITFELINRCNLKCSMCYTSHHKTPKAQLSLDDIARVIAWDGKEKLPCVTFGMSSEALLYKDIKKAISLARNAEVMDIFLFTNGTLLTADLSEFLVNEEISRLFISLDAAHPESYEKIRGKDLLKKIEKNIFTLVNLKEKTGSKLPLIRLSFCVQELNKDEQITFMEKWQGVVDHLDFQVLWDHGKVDEVIELGQSKKVTPEPSPSISLSPAETFCHYPFSYLGVWADGGVSPCCNFYGLGLTLGNIHKESIVDIWNGEVIKRLRQEFLTGKINPICQTCISARENLTSESIRRL